jgi:hypothetical protein
VEIIMKKKEQQNNKWDNKNNADVDTNANIRADVDASINVETGVDTDAYIDDKSENSFPIEYLQATKVKSDRLYKSSQSDELQISYEHFSLKRKICI